MNFANLFYSIILLRYPTENALKKHYKKDKRINSTKTYMHQNVWNICKQFCFIY